jgi:hypothetical protein
MSDRVIASPRLSIICRHLTHAEIDRRAEEAEQQYLRIGSGRRRSWRGVCMAVDVS